MGKPSSMFFVLDKLLEPIDHARFAAVCKEWSCLAEVYNEEPYNPEVIVEKYPDEATVIPGGLRDRPNHVKTPLEKILDSYRQHDLCTMRLHPNRKCADDGRESKFGEEE
ncbi:PREDICTED: F-box [Prunus dulcis]|uniref:PREDICTED: F-box n=1 Tax=Prunus dulcis TaxID=3755 RepID=A0A5E4FJG0_PRUDU|nr:PREDICTED: F-box [Prunus dulcis]